MTETKAQYIVDVSIDATLRHLDSLAHNYIAACAMRDAQRLEAGESIVNEVTDKTVRLVMGESMPFDIAESDKQVRDAFKALYDLPPEAWFHLPSIDSATMIMDGRFTLDHLKRIVAAWEALAASDESDSNSTTN